MSKIIGIDLGTTNSLAAVLGKDGPRVLRDRDGDPIVPHGMAVTLTAPEAFRFTFEASPQRHLEAARLLEPDVTGDGPDVLPGVLTRLMRDIGIPSGLAEVGYLDSDVDDLVEGALKQQRLLATAPREVRAEDLATVFRDSMHHW